MAAQAKDGPASGIERSSAHWPQRLITEPAFASTGELKRGRNYGCFHAVGD